ncbi:MAG: hypothetical protein M1829_005412 [Trizodia sp. TS-e1964]|nr:MAG: hypothetical protein M1829_005412 [Trizodia sp. TS-e1964]
MASLYYPHLAPHRLSTIEEPARSIGSPSPSPPSPTQAPTPLSPFYTYAPTRHSLDVRKSSSKPSLYIDIEAAPSSTPSLEFTQSKECAMWPGKQAIVAKQKSALRRGGCHPLARLGRRTKLGVKILIALLIVSAAVGIGVGVTKAVGGGVWRSEGSTTTIGGGG